jgi:L-fuculose-phosphate aldolase
MGKAEKALRREIVAGCRELNASGINQGTSGNISARLGGRMLISPSAVPYDTLEPEMIASLALDDPSGAWEGPLPPSTEWRFHRRLMRERADAQAVVHAHPACCTALAMARREIPAAHYMVAAFGGNSVRCAGYARYGTEALAELAAEAMEGRTACLLANHGMIAIGDTLARAMWRAVELEALARQYVIALTIGGPFILNETAIEETLAGFAGYGLRDAGGKGKSGA